MSSISSIAHYEALYRRRCTSPIFCFEVCEAPFIGKDSVNDAMKKEQINRHSVKTTQSRHKSYAILRRREVEFQVDD